MKHNLDIIYVHFQGQSCFKVAGLKNILEK